MLALLLVLPGVAACASGRVFSYASQGPELVWPAAPEPPRIRYLRSLSTPDELGRSRSLLRWAVEFFTGSRDERINQPYGISVDGAGRIYVADQGLGAVHVFDVHKRRHRLLRGEGTRRLRSPVGVAAAGAGRVFVADAEAGVVVGLDEDGDEFLRISDGLRRPAGLAYDGSTRTLYVVDVLRGEVLAFGPEGALRFSFGGPGGEEGELNYPTNIAQGTDGTLYVTDTMNFRVQLFTRDGEFIGLFGRPGDAVGDLTRPKGIALDSEGHVYVVEGLFDVVNIYTREGRLLLTVAGPGSGPGQLWLATGIFIDDQDRIYVADSFNGRIQIFQYIEGEVP